MTPVAHSGQTTRTMVWAIVAVALGTMGTMTVLAVLAPPELVEDLAAPILASLPATLAVLVTLRQVGEVRDQVQAVQQDTHDLTNGLLASSVRAGVSEVLHPHLVDPTVADRVQADQAVLEARQADELER